MSKLKKEFFTFLKVLIGIIDQLNDEQYKGLINGTGKLVYQDIEKNQDTKKDPKKIEVRTINYANKLTQFDSREKAFDFIKKMKCKKNELIDIANYHNIHILKSYTKEKIIKRIVEALVGEKLRSKAIKNTNLKG